MDGLVFFFFFLRCGTRWWDLPEMLYIDLYLASPFLTVLKPKDLYWWHGSDFFAVEVLDIVKYIDKDCKILHQIPWNEYCSSWNKQVLCFKSNSLSLSLSLSKEIFYHEISLQNPSFSAPEQKNSTWVEKKKARKLHITCVYVETDHHKDVLIYIYIHTCTYIKSHVSGCVWLLLSKFKTRGRSTGDFWSWWCGAQLYWWKEEEFFSIKVIELDYGWKRLTCFFGNCLLLSFFFLWFQAEEYDSG
jgi:hypothetical protein